MADVSPNPQLTVVGASGVVMYGGVLYHDDQDRAWRGIERDRTIRAMVSDPLVGAILHAIEMYVRRVDWFVEPADDSPVAAEVAEFVTSALADMEGTWPGDAIADIMTYIPWGYSVLEVVHKLRNGPENLDPTHRSMHSDGRIGWRGWYLRPQITRDGWLMERDEPVGFRQRIDGMFQTVVIPLNRCLYVRYGSAGGSPEGRTPLRHAYDAWYYKRQIQRIEAIGIERDLAGLPHMRIPSDDIEHQTATYTMAQKIVTSIRNDAMAGVVTASDRDEHGHLFQEFELVSTGGQRSFDTDIVIKRYANEVVIAFLANVLRVGQDATGSYALSSTMSDMFVTSLGAHLDIVQDAVNEQCVRALVRLNGWPPELTPKLKHGDIESADVARIGAYLMQLSNTGLLEDTPALRGFAHELAGLPVPSLEELEAAQAERERIAEERASAQAELDAQSRLEQKEALDALTAQRGALAQANAARAAIQQAQLTSSGGE